MKPLRVVAFLAAAAALGLLPACQQELRQAQGRLRQQQPRIVLDHRRGRREEGRRRGRRRAALPQARTRATPPCRRKIIDAVAQPGRQGHRRQRHRPEEPDATTSTRSPARCQLLTVDNDAPDTQPRLLHRHRQLRGRPGRRQAGQGGPARRRHRRHLRRRARRRSTPASAGRACSTSWPARRTSRPTTARDYGKDKKFKLYRTYTDQPGRRRRRPSRTPSPPMRGTARTSRTSAWSACGRTTRRPSSAPSRTRCKGKLKRGQIKIVGFDEDAGDAARHRRRRHRRHRRAEPLRVRLPVGQDDGGAGRAATSRRCRPTASSPSTSASSPRTAARSTPDTVHGEKKSIPVKEFREQLNELLGKK